MVERPFMYSFLSVVRSQKKKKKRHGYWLCALEGGKAEREREREFRVRLKRHAATKIRLILLLRIRTHIKF